MPRLKYSILVTLVGMALAMPASYGQGPGGERGPPPFSKLDLNGDGVMTLEEFKSHVIPHGDHAEVFVIIDTDADGVITEQEFTSHRPPSPPRR